MTQQFHKVTGTLTLAAVLMFVTLPVTGLSDPPPPGPEPWNPYTLAPDEQGGNVWASVAQKEQVFAHELLSAVDPARSPQERVLDAARMASEHRSDMVGRVLDESLAPGFDQIGRNQDLTKELLELSAGGPVDNLARGVLMAQQAARWQTESLGISPIDPIPPESHERPSDALAEVASLHEIKISNEEWEQVLTLDGIEEPVRSALTDVIEAFLAMDAAARSTHRGSDRPLTTNPLTDAASLNPASTINVGPAHESTVSTATGMDELRMGQILTSRNLLLDAVLGFRDALQDHPLSNSSDCQPVSILPSFSIDLAGCDNLYEDDIALLIDTGGNDVYHNNAGGSGKSDICEHENATAGALIDLGSGSDAYGDPATHSRCGFNGGGAFEGVGFLVDEGGDDIYIAGGYGVNGGGAIRGIGFLLDADGNDTYHTSAPENCNRCSQGFGANGGSFARSVGFLLDVEGHDVYQRPEAGYYGWGLNGGAMGPPYPTEPIPTLGFLFDAGHGNDLYDAPAEIGTNGGAALVGAIGFLLDDGGDDTYLSGSLGVNGGAAGTDQNPRPWWRPGAVGYLFDGGGDDVYRARGYGSNGGGYFFTIGFLIDTNGNDTYEALREGSNGGGVKGGVGFLVDGDGDDSYSATHRGVNGGAAGMEKPYRLHEQQDLPASAHPAAAGLLIDYGGNDVFTATDYGTNGGGHFGAIGLLTNTGGDDTYVAGGRGANGGAYVLGSGLLLDDSGNDTYIAGYSGANGGATGGPFMMNQQVPLAFGRLIDTGGTDRYEDAQGGSGMDKTVFPKGFYGAQVDQP